MFELVYAIALVNEYLSLNIYVFYSYYCFWFLSLLAYRCSKLLLLNRPSPLACRKENLTCASNITHIMSHFREYCQYDMYYNLNCFVIDVSIAVRGRYIKPRSNGRLVCDGNEKPLYLLISGKSKHHLTRKYNRIIVLNLFFEILIIVFTV